MGHIVNPTSFRAGISRFWLNKVVNKGAFYYSRMYYLLYGYCSTKRFRKKSWIFGGFLLKHLRSSLFIDVFIYNGQKSTRKRHPQMRWRKNRLYGSVWFKHMYFRLLFIGLWRLRKEIMILGNEFCCSKNYLELNEKYYLSSSFLKQPVFHSSNKYRLGIRVMCQRYLFYKFLLKKKMKIKKKYY